MTSSDPSLEKPIYKNSRLCHFKANIYVELCASGSQAVAGIVEACAYRF